MRWAGNAAHVGDVLHTERCVWTGFMLGWWWFGGGGVRGLQPVASCRQHRSLWRRTRVLHVQIGLAIRTEWKQQAVTGMYRDVGEELEDKMAPLLRTQLC
jgi:hypothetical protein